MAEYDHTFMDRMTDMDEEDFLMYLQSLPEAEREAMKATILRTVGQQYIRQRLDALRNILRE